MKSASITCLAIAIILFDPMPAHAERAPHVRIPRRPSATPVQDVFRASDGVASSALRDVSADSSDPQGQAAGSLQSTIVYGIASVLASRVKAELQAYVLDRMRGVACEDDHAIFFTNTCAYLASQDGRQLPVVFGPGFSAALTSDLVQLPTRLVENLPPDLGGTGDQLLAVLFAESVKLLVAQADPYVVAKQMIKLTTQQGEQFACQPSAQAVCKAVRVAGSVLAVGITAAQESRDAEITKALGAVGIDPAQLARLDDAIKRAIDLAKIIADAKDDTTRLPEVKPLVQAIVDAVDVLLEVAGTPQRLPLGMPELVDGLARGQLLSIVTAAVTVFKDLPGVKKLDPEVLRMISFGAELAQAKTPQDAAATIEAVSAPVGSYRLKAAQTMVSLGGLVGLGGGLELLSSDRLSAQERATSGLATPVAMVGVDFSFPTHNHVVPDVGFFVSVLDLGSVMSYRWSSDPVQVKSTTSEGSVSNTSVVGFTQLLSPGALFRVRLGDSPFVLGAGASFVPKARKIDDGMGSSEAAAIRVLASLSMDITLLPFRL